jgi:hypothetical protein
MPLQQQKEPESLETHEEDYPYGPSCLSNEVRSFWRRIIGFESQRHFRPAIHQVLASSVPDISPMMYWEDMEDVKMPCVFRVLLGVPNTLSTIQLDGYIV